MILIILSWCLDHSTKQTEDKRSIYTSDPLLHKWNNIDHSSQQNRNFKTDSVFVNHFFFLIFVFSSLCDKWSWWIFRPICLHTLARVLSFLADSSQHIACILLFICKTWDWISSEIQKTNKKKHPRSSPPHCIRLVFLKMKVDVIWYLFPSSPNMNVMYRIYIMEQTYIVIKAVLSFQIILTRS